MSVRHFRVSLTVVGLGSITADSFTFTADAAVSSTLENFARNGLTVLTPRANIEAVEILLGGVVRKPRLTLVTEENRLSILGYAWDGIDTGASVEFFELPYLAEGYSALAVYSPNGSGIEDSDGPYFEIFALGNDGESSRLFFAPVKNLAEAEDILSYNFAPKK